MVLHPGGELLRVDPEVLREGQRGGDGEADDGTLVPLAEHEARYIRRVLRVTRGRVAGPRGAARILGMNPSTLRSRMAKLGIRVERQ
jgi:transcriptional regulator with GAF, ATPase, and Fis domain